VRPTSPTQKRRHVRWRRGLGFGVGLPAVFLLTAAAVYYGELHLTVRATPKPISALLPQPRAGERLLVLAPHPDDEVLGCGGLIQRALANGADVTVAVITNGEAFEPSVALEERTLEPSREDYREYAAKRRLESREALRQLGLPNARLRFLGYPDKGLANLWSKHWSEPVRTRLAARDGDPSRLPTGSDLADDLFALLLETKPDRIFVTHPLDDHLDHAMACAFLQVALLRYASEVRERPRLYGYLIHRGDWPIPQGRYPEASLKPPSNLDDRAALYLPLTEEEIAAKGLALRSYASQTRLLGRFLSSFVRANELFFEVPQPIRVSHRRIALGDASTEWAGLEPVSKEPVADKLVRNIVPGLDVEAVYAAASAGLLHLRFDLAGRIARSGEYRVLARWFDAEGQSVHFDEKSIRPSRGAQGERVYWRNNTLEMSLPIPAKDAEWAAVRMETRLLRLTNDRTPTIFLRLPRFGD